MKRKLSVIFLTLFLLLPTFAQQRRPLFPAASASNALRFNAEGEAVQFAAQAEDWDDAGATIMAWVYVVNDRGADTGFLQVRGGGILYIDSLRRLSIYTGEGVGYNIGTVIPLGEWHHYTLTRTAGNPPSTWTAWLDGTANVSDEVTTAYTSNPQPFFGNNEYGDWSDARMAHARIWLGATLTQSEILAEKASATPVRASSLWYWNAFNNASDVSNQLGGGNNPTIVGTLTVEAGPTL